MDIIDIIRRKKGHSRDVVAGKLDVLMAQNHSTATKMWKHWRETGRMFPNTAIDESEVWHEKLQRSCIGIEINLFVYL